MKLVFKKKSICFLLLFTQSIICFSQNSLPYKLGENLTYDISFIGINVGEANLLISSDEEINNRDCFHIVGSGKTSPFFDIFFKVRDTYETFLDTTRILPVRFKRDISEGGFKKQQLYDFNHADTVVYFEDTLYQIFKSSQDMLSALFLARTFESENLKINDKFIIPIFMDEENYFLEIIYLKKDTLKTDFGNIECLVFQPLMQEGRVFENGEKMKVWISNDKNHLLMKVETLIWAGKIEAKLNNFTNIKYSLNLSIED
jgi:hypothetical protein